MLFEETLLESSPLRAPTLRGVHWAISTGVGVVIFLLAFFGLPLISAAETRVLVTQSAILGVFFFIWAATVCYVYADARRLGFNRWLWVILALVFLVGFILYLIYSAAKTDDWKRATLPIAYIFEVLVIIGMVLVPLIYTQALPKGQLMTFVVAPPPPPPPPPPPAPAQQVRIIRPPTAQEIMQAPRVIPKTIAIVKDQPQPSASVGVVGGVPGGMPGGSVGGVLGGILGSAAPPPPPPKAATPKRIRVGGQVEAARIIYQPKPDYPPLAKMARIQGTVRLEAVISKDGTIQDLKVLNGHPLLVKSALEAVQKWRYQPTLLNGEPVEVVTEIDVNFTLAE
jgi:periplasmic protein TonB